MSDFAFMNTANPAPFDSEYGNGVTAQSDEFNFVALTFVVNEHNRANIARFETIGVKIDGQNDRFQFFYHLALFLTGYEVTNRGISLSVSMNQTERTNGSRPSGV